MTDQHELGLFRDNVVRFFSEHVEPHYEDWERAGLFPRELWTQMGENAMLAVDAPEDLGGIGSSFAFSRIVVEEASRMNYGALASSISVHSDIVTPYVCHLGTEEQKQYWVPKMVTGEVVGAIAMTEPGAGSDLQGMRTRAVADGDDYLITGAKTFITNGQHADLIITAAKTDPSAGAKGVSLFLVDASLPGFRRGRNLEKMGLHSGDTSELFFDEVRVPASALLGQVGGGFGHLMDELPRERLILSLGAVAAAQGAIDRTVEYVRERKAFGTSLASFQNTRFELARMQTDLDVHRAFVNQCAALYDEGRLDPTTAAKAKLSSTEMQGRIVDGCLQLFGGYGYMSEYPISRFYADARIQRIYGGTSEIMKELIARSMLGRG